MQQGVKFVETNNPRATTNVIFNQIPGCWDYLISEFHLQDVKIKWQRYDFRYSWMLQKKWCVTKSKVSITSPTRPTIELRNECYAQNSGWAEEQKMLSEEHWLQYN